MFPSLFPFSATFFFPFRYPTHPTPLQLFHMSHPTSLLLTSPFPPPPNSLHFPIHSTAISNPFLFSSFLIPNPLHFASHPFPTPPVPPFSSVPPAIPQQSPPESSFLSSSNSPLPFSSLPTKLYSNLYSISHSPIFSSHSHTPTPTHIPPLFPSPSSSPPPLVCKRTNLPENSFN